jgi:hypothetical protein
MGDLAVHERFDHDAGDLGERRVGDRAHQADAAAAVDQLDPRPGQRFA